MSLNEWGVGPVTEKAIIAYRVALRAQMHAERLEEEARTAAERVPTNERPRFVEAIKGVSANEYRAERAFETAP